MPLVAAAQPLEGALRRAISLVHVSATPACLRRVSGSHLARHDPEAVLKIGHPGADYGPAAILDDAVQTTE